MKPLLIISLCILCAGCGIYQSSFDCPPGKGIGCKPVNEVLGLIVEKEEGEDLFAKDAGAALLLKEQEGKKRQKKKELSAQEKKKKLFLLKERSGDAVMVEAEER